jgi:hypothetical protein
MADQPPPYRPEQFTFVDEQDAPEASGWLNFVHSRAGRRADRREQTRERILLALVLLVIAALVATLLVWRPWSGGAGATDTGNEELGADRVALVLQLQDPGGAAATAVLLQDRRAKGSGALVVVPGELVLPVEGASGQTVRTALAGAGPVLSREGLAALLGVPLVGSWVVDVGDFAGLVDRLGGLHLPSGQVNGKAAVARASTGPAGAQEVLVGFVTAFPGRYTAAHGLLEDLGVLAAPGLPVPRLAAVLAGLAREQPAGRLRATALPLDASGHMLDQARALPIVRDVLGGQPGAGRTDLTPRVLVSLAPGAALSASDARADVLDAGYEYVAGPAAAAGAASAVVVRTGTADARALGLDVASLLNLPAGVVRISDDVPFGVDVAVVLGATVQGKA